MIMNALAYLLKEIGGWKTNIGVLFGFVLVLYSVSNFKYISFVYLSGDKKS